MESAPEPVPSPAATALAAVLARKPGGESRAGQEAMCGAVAAAFEERRHLLVEAPTGTGKSLAYLVPAVVHATSGPERRPVVVVTATKALQEQLIREDLPFLAEAMVADGAGFSFAMLKGRSNYLCRAKLDVSLADGVEARLDFGPDGPAGALEAVAGLGDWAGDTDTGDRADAPLAVSDAVWSQVSVDSVECPGASRCPAGDRCFAEAARDRAGTAEIVVVNAHLYATHVAAGARGGGGAPRDVGILPPHDAVVFDEAHTVEDIVSSVSGMRLSGGRLRRLAGRLRGAGGNPDLAGRLERTASGLDEALELILGAGSEARVHLAGDPDGDPGSPAVEALRTVVATAATLAGDAAADLKRADRAGPGEPGGAGDVARTKAAQAARLAEDLRGDLRRLEDPALFRDHVAWVDRGGLGGRCELKVAAVDVGPLLAERLYPRVTVVATSATLATAGRFDFLARRLGLTLAAPDPPASEPPADPPAADPPAAGAPDPRHPGPPAPAFETMVVESPFDHRRQGLLYVPVDLPDPRHESFPDAVAEELHRLVAAAGGRTLALFTSRAAKERAAAALEDRGDHVVLVQDRMTRPALLDRFRSAPGSVLIATQSFWSGIDLPGSVCRLVTIDRIPFPRPTDPLQQARREAATARREDGFTTVDLPAAATRLAQGVGRLIRTTTDEGVVAVFDRRLATARYRAMLLDTLPRFTRTIDRERVLATLARLAAGAHEPVPEA